MIEYIEVISMCYCGDKNEYSEHCKKYINGVDYPSTPLELMKSRYSAFVTNSYKYIFETYYKKTRNFSIEELINSNIHTQWLGLQILDYDNSEGIVTFIAKYKENGFIYEHKERSKFIFENNKWFYYGTLPFPKFKKIGANDSCPCNSGKKYKKCCGK